MTVLWDAYINSLRNRALVKKRTLLKDQPYNIFPGVFPKGTTSYQKLKIWRNNRLKEHRALRLQVLAWFSGFALLAMIILSIV